jgi:hypothetical protein
MAIPPDPLTPKREYLERKIHEYAHAAGVAIDDLRWDRSTKPEISELIIRSGGQEKRYSLPGGVLDMEATVRKLLIL